MGGAITQSPTPVASTEAVGTDKYGRHRPLGSSRTGKATGARKKARGCAATVGVRQSESENSLRKELPRPAS